MMSFYKGMGYKISDYPETYSLYKNEISLPVYYDLSPEQTDIVVQALIHAVESEINYDNEKYLTHQCFPFNHLWIVGSNACKGLCSPLKRHS
ncbi:MAG: hypothetical protein IPJ66_11470 [Bacteroidetes bacterium]|nr:hypothetical protein [Bacteroidota bacterium]